MQIGSLVEAVGLSLRTIRHYEDVGLVLPVGRTSGGFRLYDDDAVERLRLIMKMKPLGFSLEEMRQLIEARAALAQGAPPEEEARLLALIQAFSRAAEEKVQQLRATIEAANAFAVTLEADSHSSPS